MGVMYLTEDDIARMLLGEPEPSGETTTISYIKGPTIYITIPYKKHIKLSDKIKKMDNQSVL